MAAPQMAAVRRDSQCVILAPSLGAHACAGLDVAHCILPRVRGVDHTIRGAPQQTQPRVVPPCAFLPLYSRNRWPWLPASVSASTTSPRRSDRAGWATCIERLTPD